MSDEKSFNRRTFLKLAGLAGISAPALNIVGNFTGNEYLASREAYGGFIVRPCDKNNPPYQVDDATYQRFRQRNTMFSRLGWDKKAQAEIAAQIAGSEEVAAKVHNPGSAHGSIPEMHMKNKTPGKTRLDYAFAAGAWAVATALGSMSEMGVSGMGIVEDARNRGLYSWSPLGGFAEKWFSLYSENLDRWDPSDYSPEELTGIVKTAAKFYGASLVGIAEIDERWFYSHHCYARGQEAPIVFDNVDAPAERDDHTLVVPKSMKYVVALAFEMDYDGIRANLMGPGGAAPGNGYSRMAFTAASLAEFFRGLGYHAIPSGNGTALSSAIAVDAGLGEMGRSGFVITPKYGPRVRLAKVFTDFPLVPDKPITFGVTEFCGICGKCAETCPSGAISFGSRTWEGYDISNNPGIYKWYINPSKCLGLWIAEGMDCGQCINACPFNKPKSWLHEITRTMIGARSGLIDKALLTLDDASAYGKTASPQDFWRKKEAFIHIKD